MFTSRLLRTTQATLLAAILCLAGLTHAQSAAAGASAAAPSTAEFDQVNMTMHRDMRIGFTGDADYDFVAGMIPHHQGAIDMAEVVLRHGKDRRVKQLARDIIWAQKQEIRQMQFWMRQMEEKDPSLKARAAAAKAAAPAVDHAAMGHGAHAGHAMPAAQAPAAEAAPMSAAMPNLPRKPAHCEPKAAQPGAKPCNCPHQGAHGAHQPQGTSSTPRMQQAPRCHHQH